MTKAERVFEKRAGIVGTVGSKARSAGTAIGGKAKAIGSKAKGIGKSLGETGEKLWYDTKGLKHQTKAFREGISELREVSKQRKAIMKSVKGDKIPATAKAKLKMLEKQEEGIRKALSAQSSRIGKGSIPLAGAGALAGAAGYGTYKAVKK